ncbi:MAG: hypothetical protein R3F11_20185 [Verrucomicrobiales bacterium]
MPRTKQKNAAETRAMEFGGSLPAPPGLPLSAWVRYYIGAVPFYLGVLFLGGHEPERDRRIAGGRGGARHRLALCVDEGFSRAVLPGDHRAACPLGALPRTGRAGIFRRTAALLCAHAFAAPAYAIGFSLLPPAYFAGSPPFSKTQPPAPM